MPRSKVICNKFLEGKCNSDDCSHQVLHTKNKRCKSLPCSFSSDTEKAQCIPKTRKDIEKMKLHTHNHIEEDSR